MPIADLTPTVGFGSQFYWKLKSGSTYTQAGYSVDLKSPEPEIGTINFTNNSSPNNTKEYVAGMVEPGTTDVDLIYDKTTYAAIYATFGDGNVYTYAIVFADGSGFTWDGFLTKYPVETKTEDSVNKCTLTIKNKTKAAFTATLTVATS